MSYHSLAFALSLACSGCVTSEPKSARNSYSNLLDQVSACVAVGCDKVKVSSFFDDVDKQCLSDTIKSRAINRTGILNSLTLGNNIPVVYLSPSGNCPKVEIGVAIVSDGSALKAAYIEPVLD